MNTHIVGRESEIAVLEELLKSNQPELLAIYGRRRVGKTFLIKAYFHDHIVFSCTGQHRGKKEEQLLNFTEKLNTYFPEQASLTTAKTWQTAFNRLKDGLLSIKSKKKKVVFIDELPWLDSHKSGFLSSFSYFWNAYASERSDIIVVICGSAASWIIEKVINDKGGLHNRITKRIRLLPFNLRETQQYLLHKKINLGHYELLQLYMVMGGIPAYLNEVQRGKSVAQNIEAICFSKDGILAGEFSNLYAALFASPENHIQVIRALAKKNKGLTREEIVAIGKLTTGGTLSKVLSELDESGFIQKIYPFGKREKESVYRLTDEFSLFYFKFMHERKMNEKGQWIAKQATPSYISWCGYAFENICIKHIVQIKQALQIGGVHSDSASWIFRGNKNNKGAQIDLLIDRTDHCINICEAKFSTKQFAIDKKYADELKNKILAFRTHTNTRKTLFLTFITTYGLLDNQYKQQLADGEITMDALFYR
jgi:AAA+ ATPase superfamily predicted ATPase